MTKFIGVDLGKAIGGKGIFLALALAGAVFQGCTTEDKPTSPAGTGPGADTAGAAGYEVIGSAGKDNPGSLIVDSVQQVEDEKLVDDQAGSPKDTVVTPFGRVERRCVEEVRPGEVLQDENTVATQNGLRKIAIEQGCDIIAEKTGTAENYLTAPPKPAVTNGWVMAGWWNLPFVGYSISSNFTVPSEPAHQGNQLLFLFSSFEDAKGSWIVQPVLQWGSNGAFGSKYWMMANWIVGPKKKVFYSTPVKVYPGNKLSGDQHGRSCKPDGECTWDIVMTNKTKKTHTELKSNVLLPAMKSAQGGVLEVYNLTRCDEYPAQEHVDFTAIEVTDTKKKKWSSAWTGSANPVKPDCHFNVTMRQDTSSGVGLHWKPNL